MIKIPARPDGQWTVQYNNEKMPDIVGTRNLSFDKEGYLTLAKPVVSFFSESDDVDFDLPIGFFNADASGNYLVITDEAQFDLNMYNSGNYGVISCAQSTATDVPENTSTTNAAGVDVFNQQVVYMNPTDRKLYYVADASAAGSTWQISDVSAGLEAGSNLFCRLSVSDQTLAVINDNQVDVINTSYAISTPQLSIPNDYSGTGIAYSNNFMGITTHAKNNFSNCQFYIWDAVTTAANYAVEIPSTTCYSPVGYKNGFVFLDGNSLLWYCSLGGVLQLLAALPAYFTNSTFSLGINSGMHYNGIVTDGELIHINIKSVLTTPDSKEGSYLPTQPGGVYTYDPAVGLYHHHAPSGVKIITDVVATGDVNTATDEITVTTAYDTGTPVRYSATGGTAITGLVSGTLYYTIKVDATTIKLASSYTNAIDGTAIDLTGTGNANQILHFYRKSDFGQSYLDRQQGAIRVDKNKGNSSELFYDTFFIGTDLTFTDITNYYAAGCFTLIDSENRGHFTTAKFRSVEMQEDWQKMFIKHSKLITGLDKIVVKYRTTDNEPVTRIKTSTDGTITWSDSDTFTTTDTQWADVVAGDEVEVIQGAGSGYLFHITSIAEAGGTYTVNLDESVKNVTAADVGRAIVSRWKKLTTLSSGIITNTDGYSEITVGVKSKQIQFKIELRGEDVSIEEILVAHAPHKPVA